MRHKISGITFRRRPKAQTVSEARSIIDSLIEQQHAREESWVEHLEPIAAQLCTIGMPAYGLPDPPEQAINAALAAWRLGGEPCMRKLRQMAVEKCEPQMREAFSECISIWWDGIGTWKAEPVLAR